MSFSVSKEHELSLAGKNWKLCASYLENIFSIAILLSKWWIETGVDMKAEAWWPVSLGPLTHTSRERIRMTALL